MKKFTSIFLMLFMMSMGAWATVTMPTLTTDSSNPELYCIQSYRAYTFVQYADDDAAITPTFDFTSDNAKFYFVPVNGSNFDEGVKIVNKVSGKQLVEVGTGFADEGTTWYIKENPYNAGYFCISKTSDLSSGCWDCNSSGVMTNGYWHPASGDFEGTSWLIAKVPQYETSTLENPKWYYLKSGRGNYVYANGSTAGLTSTNNKTDDYKFAFISVGGTGVNIVSKTGLANGNNQYLTTTPELSSTPSTWYYFNAVRYTGYFLLSDDASSYGYPHLLNDNGNGGLAKWHVDGTGSYFQVEEVLPICEVTYTYTYGGNTYTATETQNIGAPVALPASITFPYTNYSFSTDVVPDASQATVNVTVDSFSMPFEASTDYSSATWYFMKGHATYSDYYISTNEDATVWAQGKESTDAYKWAFVGNPIEGVKLINKASGNGKYLMATNPATMGETAQVWTLKQQTNTSWQCGENGFGFYDASTTYLNTQGRTLKYWSDFDQGSTFWVEEVPDAAIDVTYNFVVDGETVNTIVDAAVAMNSEVSVPDGLTNGYSPLCYDFVTTGAIGETDCTITVTGTLKNGVVTELSQLSNEKVYTLTTERGSLGTNGTQMVSTAKEGFTASNFALVKYEEKYYLYSAADKKFVSNETAPQMTDDISKTAALNLTAEATKHLFFVGMGTNGVNISGGYDPGLIVNGWTSRDAGNQYAIIEAGAYDLTDALAALEEYFHPAAEAQFNSIIEQLKVYPYGKGVNQYSLFVEGSDYTSQAATIIEGLENQGYSEQNFAVAQALLEGTSINLPASGFYRIKGYSGNYVTLNTENANASMNGETGLNNIVCFSNGNLIFYNGGNGLYNTSIVAPVGSTLNEYTFSQGAQIGHYNIKSNASGVGTYCYDNTANGSKLDRNSSAVTSGNYQTDWTLEEVTELPVALNQIGDKYYATFVAPVAVEFGNDVDAYVVKVNDDKTEAVQSKISDKKVPANTAVVLESTSNSATATVCTEAVEITYENDLVGTLAAIDVTDESEGVKGSTDYFLGRKDGEPGFFHWKGTVLKGFRAYLPADKAGGAKELTLVDGDVTGINTVETVDIQNQEIYNLQGQKVNRTQKGVFIVNGKKVVIK